MCKTQITTNLDVYLVAFLYVLRVTIFVFSVGIWVFVVYYLAYVPNFPSGERMQDLDITVGLTTTQLRFCAHFTGPGYNGQDIEILCDNVLLGRFIKLVLTKPYAMSMLNIAEVSIFAYV